MSLDSKFYDEDVKNITRIDFSYLSNTEIKKYSAVKNDPFGINVPDSYDNYEPKKGGLVDLRLGTCDIYLPCTTCGLNSVECPGHFGHTELADPVFHYGFMNYLRVTLQSICLRCSNILVEDKEKYLKSVTNMSNKARFKKIKDTTKNLSYCYYCGAPVPKIKKEVKESTATIKILVVREVGNVTVDEQTGESTEVKKKITDYLSPRDCYNILRNISDEDCFLLGYEPEKFRPEDLVMNRFPIPPVCIRPTGKIDFLASSTMEDSLTLKIADILKANSRVRSRMEKKLSGSDLSSLNNTDFNTLLQYHIATYFDNESASLPKSEFKSGNKPTKSISERIKAKGGRIRSNLMGKRVDFSARSVITSDPYIDIDQVGVPLKVALNMTVPEEVTPYNIKYLSNLVKNGAFNYPGANYIYKKNYINGKKINQRIDLKYRKKSFSHKLSYGDIVQRHIINDDYVLFNRQPTLHKPSMMGHRVQVLNRDDCNTFRMNVSVTGPYGADFDGDEMNIHLAQSVQARNELERITNVKYQIVGAKNSNPIIGCVQDTVSGAYLISQKDSKIEYFDACNFLCNTSSKNKVKLKKNKNITGSELFSYIIPSKINSKKGKYFEIKNGSLLKGVLDKTQLSTKRNSIIHYVWDKYGPDETRHFIDNSQRLILNYLMNRGMSIGFGDILTTDNMNEKIKNYVNTTHLSVKFQITEAENNKDNVDINKEIIESSIRNELNAIGPNIGKMIVDSLDNKNTFYVLVKSKAKGNPTNIQKAFGCLGQMNVDGGRIEKKVNGRTLPYFHKDDDTPEARGFINRSYLDGLEGHHYVWDAMVGRSGLIDTAIKTSHTGYLQRKLIKGLEDLSVKYDGTVRLPNNTLIQYVYGENGINQLTQTEVNLNFVEYSNKELENEYAFTKTEIKKLKKSLKVSNLENFNKKYVSMMKKNRDYLREICFKFTLDYKNIQNNFMLPVNIYRLTQEYSNEKEKIKLKPDDVIKGIEDIFNDYDCRLLTLFDGKNKLFNNDENSFKTLYKIAIYDYLAPKKCIFKYGLDKESFKKLCDDIKLNFIKSLVEPGEMVGVIAAQSCGEPLSQMTLDSKHSAGSATVATGGVPRIQELLSYSKSINTPQMIVYFNKDISNNKQLINRISSHFKHLTLRELIDSAEILYKVDGDNNYNKILNNDNTKIPFFINNKKVDIDTLPIIIRLKMNIEKLLEKNTTLLDIKTRFISYWYNNFTNLKSIKRNHKDIISKIDKLAILNNTDNIIHIKFDMQEFNYNLITDFLKIVLDVVTLKGLNKIKDSIITDDRLVNFDNKSGKMEVLNENYVVTSGINFLELC